MINSDISYSVKNGLVYIKEPFQEPFPLNEKNVLLAIENIKKNKSDYKTSDSWMRELGKYEDALAYLKAAKKSVG